jgi:hypothetical protein
MNEKIIFAEFNPLFSEVKRRLGNQDSKEVWSTKVCEFIRALAVKDRHAPGGLPPALDAIWHECILNTRDYARLCKRVRRKFVHHTTTTEQDDDVEKSSRIDATVIAYRKRFREEPVNDVWDIDMDSKESKEQKNALTLIKGGYGFYVKTLELDSYWIKAEGSDTIEEIKKKLCLKQPGLWTTCEMRLIHAGRQLEDGRTCADYNIKREDTLHLIMRLRGC